VAAARPASCDEAARWVRTNTGSSAKRIDRNKAWTGPNRTWAPRRAPTSASPAHGPNASSTTWLDP
jgi:hypothetical protein